MKAQTKQRGVFLNKKILEHWIYDDKTPFSKREAWIDMLLCANDREDGFLIGGKRFVCKRGECLYSLETWAKRWRWDKSKVRRYFDKLSNDKMVVINNEKKTTRITICNYDTYNTIKHATDTAPTPRDIILSTDSIKKKKAEFGNMLAEFKNVYPRDMLVDFHRYWTEMTKDKKHLRWEREKTWETALRLITWGKKSDEMAASKRTYKQQDYDLPLAADN